MSECPICAGSMDQEENLLVGELRDCPDCGSELEVVSVAPFRLREAPMEEEDWGQ